MPRLTATRAAVSEVEFGDVEVFELGLGEMRFAEVAMQNCVGLIQAVREFSLAERSEAEADVLGSAF